MLNKKIAIYVPSTFWNKPIPQTLHDEYVEKAARIFSSLFGGATAQKASGFWKNCDGELVCENITIIYAFTDADGLENHKNDIIDFALRIGKELNQECVSVEIDGELLFI